MKRSLSTQRHWRSVLRQPLCKLAPTLQAQSQSPPSALQEAQKSQTFVGKVIRTKMGSSRC